jgi:hypothetical protein
VLSGIGKDITASALGAVFKARGFTVPCKVRPVFYCGSGTPRVSLASDEPTSVIYGVIGKELKKTPRCFARQLCLTKVISRLFWQLASWPELFSRLALRQFSSQTLWR